MLKKHKTCIIVTGLLILLMIWSLLGIEAFTTVNISLIKIQSGFDIVTDIDEYRYTDTKNDDKEDMVDMGRENTSLCVHREPTLSDRALPRTALASFMGSGNTWTRHLIQQMSGLATSAVYCDRSLARNGFPYECYRNQTRVAVVKTHRARGSNHYDKAVLLLRNPYDTFISATNWQYAGHVRHADTRTIRSVIDAKLDQYIAIYKGMVNAFVKNFKGPVLILQYEHLKSNLTSTLTELAVFLNLNVSQKDVDCTVRLQIGNHHRHTDPEVRKRLLLDIYDDEKEKKISDAMTEIEEILHQRLNKSFIIPKFIQQVFDK